MPVMYSKQAFTLCLGFLTFLLLEQTTAGPTLTVCVPTFSLFVRKTASLASAQHLLNFDAVFGSTVS